MSNPDENPEAWQAWIAEVAATLNVPTDSGAMDPILDLAARVAHRKYRPMAPVTAYLVGLAVGQGDSLPEAIAKVDTLLPAEKTD